MIWVDSLEQKMAKQEICQLQSPFWLSVWQVSGASFHYLKPAWQLEATNVLDRSTLFCLVCPGSGGTFNRSSHNAIFW